MMFETWTVVILIWANVLGGAMALPQAIKTLRTGRTEGVSTVWIGLSVGVNLWWVAYGLGVDDIGIVPVGAISVTAYSLIGLGVARALPSSARSRPVAQMVASAVAVGSVPAFALWVGGWPVAGVILGLLYGVQLSPAVVTAYRSADVSGMSASTWIIALVEAVLWGVYGLVRADSGLLALAATGIVMSVLVLARLTARRPRGRRRGHSRRLSPTGRRGVRLRPSFVGTVPIPA
ncbi:MAG: hypothetical protein AAF945_07040 [Actinomycetota bacterium]